MRRWFLLSVDMGCPSVRSMKKGPASYSGECRPVSNKPPPFKGRNIRISLIIPIKGKGLINQGSTLNERRPLPVHPKEAWSLRAMHTSELIDPIGVI